MTKLYTANYQYSNTSAASLANAATQLIIIYDVKYYSNITHEVKQKNILTANRLVFVQCIIYQVEVLTDSTRHVLLNNLCMHAKMDGKCRNG